MSLYCVMVTIILKQLNLDKVILDMLYLNKRRINYELGGLLSTTL